ncbi:MAG: hypothetical protein ACJ8AT_37105 [Hyalangium sp.]|uniref:hypothetical protein n=1 Tax=Hyalangium sp. TaxID=2028555 RepID=UPI00389A1570
MKPLMLAALVVQLTSAGGAGSGTASEQEKAGSSAADVGKHFSALKNEVTSLSQQFREARQKARLEAERKKQESEGVYAPPNQRTAAVPSTPGGQSL